MAMRFINEQHTDSSNVAFSKNFWMKHEWQDVFQRTAMFADIKTYIFYHLFDTYIIDYSMASATGMFNLETLDWDVEALELLGISKEMLPEIVPTTYVMKGMKNVMQH